MRHCTMQHPIICRRTINKETFNNYCKLPTNCASRQYRLILVVVTILTEYIVLDSRDIVNYNVNIVQLKF